MFFRSAEDNINGFANLCRNPDDLDDKMVNDPKHYQGNCGMTVRDVIKSFDFDKDFNLGSAIKYILRCNKKGNKKIDLKKAINFLNESISEGQGIAENKIDVTKLEYCISQMNKNIDAIKAFMSSQCTHNSCFISNEVELRQKIHVLEKQLEAILGCG